MKKFIQALALAASLTVGLGTLAHAAPIDATLKVKSQKYGDIKGSVTQKGREGTIKVINVKHEIISPRDAATGLPTGKRTHKPIVIVKEIDKSTPMLSNMLVNNENLPTWDLNVYSVGAGGVSKLTYTIKLTNASISAIRTYSDDTGKLFEEVSFTYQKIEWTWTDGGITAQDDWESPMMGSKTPPKPKPKAK